MRPLLLLSLLLCGSTLAMAQERLTEVGIGQVQVYLTPEQGRRQLFPSALAFERQVRHISAAAREKLESELGRGFADDSLEVFLAHGTGGKFLGYAIASEEIGKFRPITFMVGIDPSFRVSGAAVLVYRESRGGEVRQPRFLRQYRGKSLKDPIRLNRDIVNITGATLSVRSLNFGVRKLLALAEHLYGPTQSAMH
jgi:predicted Rdx family selenoprotein